MKRLIASIALLLIISTYLLSCEKDDICADGTPTTPSLFIEFYQKDNQDVPKSVNIKFYAEGSDKLDSIKETSMKLPLRVDANFTKWYLRYDQITGAGTTSNIDTLTFNYQTKTTYVSRACGYKTTFVLDKNTQQDNPVGGPQDNDNWITNFIVLNNNIENEEKAHIKIYL